MEGQLEVTIPDDAVVNVIAEGLLQQIRNDIQLLTESEPISEEDVPTVLRLRTQGFDSTTEDDSSRRRRTTSASTTASSLTKHTLARAEKLREELLSAANSHAEGRNEVLTESVRTLLDGMQNMAIQLNVLALVIGDLLPQPDTRVGDTSYARRFGAMVGRDALQGLHREVQCSASSSLGEGPFGSSEAVAALSMVNPLITELMALFEEADFLANASSHDGEGSASGGSVEGMPIAGAQGSAPSTMDTGAGRSQN